MKIQCKSCAADMKRDGTVCSSFHVLVSLDLNDIKNAHFLSLVSLALTINNAGAISMSLRQ